jgi:cytochrome c biogenesis protein CcmG/thiol:disulfide interchange protein DsbE
MLLLYPYMFGPPDEQPQRKREYSGPLTTLGIAVVIITFVGLAFWFFEMRVEGEESTFVNDEFGVIALDGDTGSINQPPVPSLGRLAPNFRLPNIHDEVVRLSDFRGRYVLLNFWASWCGPCRKEAPELSVLSDRFPETLIVLGINQQETIEAVTVFVSQFAVSYQILLDFNGQVSSTYAVSTGLPISLLIDPNGVIREIYVGILSQEQYKYLAETYLS